LVDKFWPCIKNVPLWWFSTSWSLVLQLPVHCKVACTGNVLVISRCLLARCPLVTHSTRLLRYIETSIFVSELSYLSLPSGQHPRQRSRFSPWARLGTVARSLRKNPRSFLGNLPGARGNNITSLIPVTSHSALTSHPCSHSQVVVSPAIDSISGLPAAREARMRRAHHEGGSD
jgi:hypothetical protein